ncbi:MAG: winged helix-turn-helix domain-containing protein [Candidatus Delongbacteria bacterium]
MNKTCQTQNNNMKNILIFNKNMPEIDFIARNATDGPEIKLVNNFIRNQLKQLRKRKSDFAIFLEPQIDNSFPDIVIAEFNKSSFENWNKTRNSLNHSDLKIYHHIFKTGKTSFKNISKQLGIEEKRLNKILSKLEVSGLITKTKLHVTPTASKDTLGVKRIISIEAKIGSFAKALLQAQTNKWFASESYVLTDSKVIKETTKINSAETGIGIFTIDNNKINKVSSPHKQEYPACFTSLLFNEWIGRRLNKEQVANS